jgi:NAD(P)-dependent dehydrogenase (short-subunit alcohol dehydrogenase family)
MQRVECAAGRAAAAKPEGPIVRFRDKVVLGGALAIRSDVADLASLDTVMSTIKNRYGRIDALFVNAGIGTFAPVREVTEALWDQVHDINLKGCFFAAQKALPQMIAAVPMHRMGRAEEVAKAVLFLASDDASFITGVDLFVDGGCVEL